MYLQNMSRGTFKEQTLRTKLVETYTAHVAYRIASNFEGIIFCRLAIFVNFAYNFFENSSFVSRLVH